MANFCGYCGRRLENGEKCNCIQSQRNMMSNGWQENFSQTTEFQNSYVSQKKLTYTAESFSLLSLICGIIGCSINTGLVPGILAIVFFIVSKKRRKWEDHFSKKMAIAGLVLGIIAISVWLFNIISYSMTVAEVYNSIW